MASKNPPVSSPVGVLPTGTISMSQVNTELGRPANQGISLNDGGVRGLADVPSGQISMSQLHGKSSTFKIAMTNSEAYVSLFGWLVARGWNQQSPVELTINGGVYIYSDNANSPAMIINGSYPKGIQIINHGIIMGRGGNGNDLNGGGVALSIQASSISFASDGYVAGGGGCGGYSEYNNSRSAYASANGGGGAGGGVGGKGYYDGDFVPTVDVPGGAGGGLSGAGGDGELSSYNRTNLDNGKGGGAGGGGGVSIAKTTNPANAAATGAGGGGRSVGNPYGGGGGSVGNGSYGGNGGAYNNAGADSTPTSGCGGGGGGFGAAGGIGKNYNGNTPGSAGGNAIALNGYSVNFQSYGNIWGAIS